MKASVVKFLKAIRVLDEDDTVSFTSLYLYAGLALVSCQVNEYTLGLLTIIFVHTNLKRLSAHKRQSQADKRAEAASAKEVEALKPNEDIKKIKQDIATLTQIVNLK